MTYICALFQDGDSPLTYKVSYSTDPMAPSDLLYKGLSRYVTFHLPAGRVENDYAGACVYASRQQQQPGAGELSSLAIRRRLAYEA